MDGDGDSLNKNTKSYTRNNFQVQENTQIIMIITSLYRDVSHILTSFLWVIFVSFMIVMQYYAD